MVTDEDGIKLFMLLLIGCTLKIVGDNRRPTG